MIALLRFVEVLLKAYWKDWIGIVTSLIEIILLFSFKISLTVTYVKFNKLIYVTDKSDLESYCLNWLLYFSKFYNDFLNFHTPKTTWSTRNLLSYWTSWRNNNAKIWSYRFPFEICFESFTNFWVKISFQLSHANFHFS